MAKLAVSLKGHSVEIFVHYLNKLFTRSNSIFDQVNSLKATHHYRRDWALRGHRRRFKLAG